MAEIGDGLGTSYPGALDTNSTPEVNSPNVGKTKARKEVVQDLAFAVVAVEATLGTNPQGGAASVGARIAKGHNPDGTHLAWIDAADYSNFTNAITAAAGKTLLIRSNITVDAAYTFPSGTHVEVTHAGSFTWASGGSLVWAAGSTLVAPPGKQVFINFGTANVTLGSGSVMRFYPQLFGAIGNGSTDNTTALQASINCAARSNLRRIYIPAGTYKYTKLYTYYDATLNPNYPSGSFKGGRIKITGVGMMDVQNYKNNIYYGTVLESTDTTGNLFNLNNGTGANVNAVVLEDMSLTGATTGRVLNAAYCPVASHFERLFVGNDNRTTGGVGFYMSDGYQTTIHEVYIEGRKDGVGSAPSTGVGEGFVYELVNAGGGQSNWSNILVRFFATGFRFGSTYDAINTKVAKGYNVNHIEAQHNSGKGFRFLQGFTHALLQDVRGESGNLTCDIEVSNSAEHLTFVGGTSSSPNTTLGCIVLGGNTGIAGQDACKHIKFEQYRFRDMSVAAIRKYAGAKDITLEDCAWYSGAEIAISVDDGDLGGLRIIRPNWQAIVAANAVAVGRRVVYLSGGTYNDRRGYCTYIDDDIPSGTTDLNMSTWTRIPSIVRRGTTGGSVTITLPTAPTLGETITVWKRDNANTLTIDSGTGATIGGTAQTYDLLRQGSAVTLRAITTTLWAILSETERDATVQTPAYSATLTPSVLSGLIYAPGTLTGNLTIGAPTGMKLGMRLIFQFFTNASGAWTVTFNSVFRCDPTSLPANIMTTTISKYSSVAFIYNGANWIQDGPALVGM